MPIDYCMLMDEGINRTLGELQGHCADTTQVSVRYGTGTGDVLVQPTLKNPDVPVATGQKHFSGEAGRSCFPGGVAVFLSGEYEAGGAAGGCGQGGVGTVGE